MNTPHILRKILPKSVAGRIFLSSCLLLGIAVCVIAAVPLYGYWGYTPKAGDVIFQSLPHNPLVDAIEGITGSPYSHCGIVVEKDGEWFVLEAIGPVRETPLFSWISRGRKFNFDVYRLKSEHAEAIPEFIKAARGYSGLPYDIKYEMDDEKIYCSELIYKAFKTATDEELGELKALGEMNWKPYAKTIEYFESGPVPTKRMMITPVAVSKSTSLNNVFSYY